MRIFDLHEYDGKDAEKANSGNEGNTGQQIAFALAIAKKEKQQIDNGSQPERDDIGPLI